ncbi:MAG: V-type ATP synthase subunit I [Christensenella sp.]|nr:V-type ATP synthase subunit I [Christensenella sp.]
MKRITLIAHKGDEADILSALQATRAVEVIPFEGEGAGGALLERATARLQTLSDALKTIRPYAWKRGMFAAAPEVRATEIAQSLPEAIALSEKLSALSRELAATKSEIDKNETMIESLRPWSSFPADMQAYQTSKRVKYFTGTIAAADVDKLQNIDATSEYQLFNEGIERTCVVACPNGEAKSVANFLKSLAWTDFAFPKLSGTPAEAMVELSEKNRTLTAKKVELESGLCEAASGKNDLVERAFDAAAIERDRALAATELARSNATFQLEGWIPADQQAVVEQAVASVTDAYFLEVREPEEAEGPPSYVENNRFNTPFEQVTNLYSRPDPKGIDATPYMTPFYVLLFGMMLSDTGYGLVLSLLCLLFLKLKKPTGGTAGFARVLFWGGLSTVIWGVLIGTFFGMDFDVLFGTVDRFPLILDPMTDPIGMLIICFGLGILHILFGLGLKMKIALSRGDWQTAIYDTLSWIFVLVGLVVFGVASVLAGVPKPVGKIGMYMAILGAATLLLFKGREAKNPVGRTAQGLFELYQISGYLSDILSYSRLFALGVATGVIATVFNDLCGMLMTSPNSILKILGTIIAGALLIALHGFGLAINTLGAFVHCARLQYVEFFGKFYEAGGRAFQPLGYRTKHVRIVNESAVITNE